MLESIDSYKDRNEKPAMPKINFSMKGNVPYLDTNMVNQINSNALPPIQSGQVTNATGLGSMSYRKRAPVDKATKSWLYNLDDDEI